MPKITSVLLGGSFEIVRSKICEILADELNNQRVLNQEALDAELLLPVDEQDQALIYAYNLNLQSIPTRVYEERNTKITSAEIKVLNVLFTGVDNVILTTNSKQDVEAVFIVEAFQTSYSTEEDEGDKLSAIKLHRLINICWKIMHDRNFLDFEESSIVGRRTVDKIDIGNIQDGASDADFMTYGSFNIRVKISESVREYQGIPLLESNTIAKVSDTKGYAWLTTENIVEGDVLVLGGDFLKLDGQSLTLG